MRACLHCGQDFDDTLSNRGTRYVRKVKLYCSRHCYKKAWRLKHPDEPRDPKWQAKRNETKMIHRLEVLRAIGVGKDWVCPCGRFSPPQIDHIQDRGYWSGEEHRARTYNSVTEDLWRMWRDGVDITKIVQSLCASCNTVKFIRSRTLDELIEIYTRLPSLKEWQPDGPEVCKKEGKWWEVSFDGTDTEDSRD